MFFGPIINDMRQKSIDNLLAEAQALPVATLQDFSSGTPYPSNVDPDRLRVIKNTPLRSRLIMTGFAEGIQSPKGMQRFASIILLYPNGDAPARVVKPRLSRRKNIQESPRLARGNRPLPTIEEMERLCQRIRSEEQNLATKVIDHADQRMQELQRALGAAPPHSQEFTRLYHELGSVLEARRNHSGLTREEAFKRILGDQAFPLRPFLSLLSTAA